MSNLDTIIKGRLSAMAQSFDTSRLLDRKEPVFITVTAFNCKTAVTEHFSARINSELLVPAYPGYPDGVIPNKESVTEVFKVSRADPISPDETVYVVSVVAESKRDANVVNMDVTEMIGDVLRELNLIK